MIALGAVQELEMAIRHGYHRALAVTSSLVGSGRKKEAGGGVLGDAFRAAGTAMLAAIGIIIVSKTSAHRGVAPTAREPLHLLAEVPHSFDDDES